MAGAAQRGPQILDRYVLHDEIASGGMAAVHFGQVLGAAGFARTVAIKRLHPQFARDPEFVTMFLDEARLAARVRHPNVVATLDVVSTADELFLVMEYVPGESLSSLWREARRAGVPIPAPVVAAVIAGALLGLHAAHEALTEDGRPLEIVHRDVSPHNVLVGQDGSARVLDFGVARATVRSQVTREGQLKGKLRYMAPEQLKGATATRRSDLYAAAVVLWEGLTGERLFEAESEAALYGHILEGVTRPPSAAARVGPRVDAMVLRGLARDPAARYATALEMATALEAAIPPASPREVAAWLEHVAGPVLAARARRVMVIEGRRASLASIPPLDARPPLPSEPVTQTDDLELAPAEPAGFAGALAPDGPPTSTQTVATRAREPAVAQRGSWRAVAVAAGALFLGGSLAAATLGGDPARIEAARRGVGAAALLAILRARTAEEIPAAAIADASAPAESAPSAAPARRGPPRAKPRSACDPPYYVDETGIRRVKRECL